MGISFIFLMEQKVSLTCHVDPEKDLGKGKEKDPGYGSTQTGYGSTQTGYGTTLVGCRGGSLYVEGDLKI